MALLYSAAELFPPKSSEVLKLQKNHFEEMLKNKQYHMKVSTAVDFI